MGLFDRLQLALVNFKEVARSDGNPLIIMIMGFISDLLLLLYKSGQPSDIGVRIAKVVAYGMREFSNELGQWVTKTPTPYDDKLVGELFEVIDQILTKYQLLEAGDIEEVDWETIDPGVFQEGSDEDTIMP